MTKTSRAQARYLASRMMSNPEITELLKTYDDPTTDEPIGLLGFPGDTPMAHVMPAIMLHENISVLVIPQDSDHEDTLVGRVIIVEPQLLWNTMFTDIRHVRLDDVFGINGANPEIFGIGDDVAKVLEMPHNYDVEKIYMEAT